MKLEPASAMGVAINPATTAMVAIRAFIVSSDLAAASCGRSGGGWLGPV
jgi:hypothetical protein